MEKYEDLFVPTFLKNTEKRTQLPSDYSLAMAYIPLQDKLKIYEDGIGFSKGTIFPELNKPFKGKMVDTK